MNKISWMGLLMILASLFSQASAQGLYHETTYTSLVNDQKAFRVGDSLTVVIVENSTANSKTDHSTNRSNDISLDASTSLRGDRSEFFNAGADVSSESGGGVSRSGKLVARVTVTVEKVYENGELRVAGGQIITINEEDQIIKVTGRIRPKDIGNNNAVLSTRLANANISYNGNGSLGGEPGLITKLFNFLF